MTVVGHLHRATAKPAFRELERDAVVAALAEHDGVLALGGGAVLDPRTQLAAAAGTPVVFLDVGDLGRRAADRAQRDRPPAADRQPPGPAAQLMDERRPVYERVATAIVRHRRAGPRSRWPTPSRP